MGLFQIRFKGTINTCVLCKGDKGSSGEFIHTQINWQLVFIITIVVNNITPIESFFVFLIIIIQNVFLCTLTAVVTLLLVCYEVLCVLLSDASWLNGSEWLWLIKLAGNKPSDLEGGRCHIHTGDNAAKSVSAQRANVLRRCTRLDEDKCADGWIAGGWTDRWIGRQTVI